MLDRFGVELRGVFASQGRDPLAELIVEAHRNGMEVIPWFEYGFAATFGDQTGGRLIQANPQWAARNSSGQFFSKNGFYWMNGLHPEVQELLMSLIHEVIDNYDIDGIQGDDRLPAMPSEAGYDAFTVELYKSEHDGASPPDGYLNNDWLLWRADKLTNFLVGCTAASRKRMRTSLSRCRPAITTSPCASTCRIRPGGWIPAMWIWCIRSCIRPSVRPSSTCSGLRRR